MKTNKLLRKTLAVTMAAAMLCTGAAVIPQLTDSQITAKAVSNNSDEHSLLNTNQSITDSIGGYDIGYYSFTLKNASKVSFTFKQHAQYEVEGSAVSIEVKNEKTNCSYVYSCTIGNFSGCMQPIIPSGKFRRIINRI